MLRYRKRAISEAFAFFMENSLSEIRADSRLKVETRESTRILKNMFGWAFIALSLIAPPLLTQHYHVAFEVVRNPHICYILFNLTENHLKLKHSCSGFSRLPSGNFLHASRFILSITCIIKCERHTYSFVLER